MGRKIKAFMGQNVAMWYQGSLKSDPNRKRVWKAWPTKLTCGSTTWSFVTGPNLLEIVPEPMMEWKLNTRHPSFLYVVPSSPCTTTGRHLLKSMVPSSESLKTSCPALNFRNLFQKSVRVGPHLAKVSNPGPNPNSFSSFPLSSRALTQDVALM